MFDVFSTKFAQDIYFQKYSLEKQEKWEDTCKRVVSAVCGQLLDKEDQEEIFKLMLDRKFIPGGRYLYSAGRPWHQVNNCFLFKADDSREGWADAMQKATASLMSGGGIGFDYSQLRPEGAKINKTGGTSTGSIALMNMVNEAGRHIMQGGARRSAIWSGLNWKHGDIQKFLYLKDWPQELKELKKKDLTFQLPMELTNISVIYDTEFFIAIEDKKHPLHKQAKETWLQNCKQAFSTAEPGMSFNFRKDAESLRNACVTGETEILTSDGYVRIDSVVDQEVEVWNGFEFSKVTPKITGKNLPLVTVSLSNGQTLTCTEYHRFETAVGYTGKSESILAKDLQPGIKLIKHDYPIIEHGPELDQAYTNGFVSAEGM
jgi:ribonucleoside-diphosphate reductase alpha chain